MTPYEEGQKAYIGKKSPNINPYPKSNGVGEKRIEWFNGYYDRWRIHKYGLNKEEVEEFPKDIK